MNEEIWKAIADFEGIYEVSNMGRVRALIGRAPRLGMVRPILAEPRIIKSSVNKVHGYCEVGLYNQNGCKKFRVNRLVLLTFIGPCPDGFDGSHLDGGRTNNELSNLLWETKKENNARKHSHGTAQNGERHNRAKLKNADILSIRALHDGGTPKIEIAKQFGVTRTMISYIVRRKNWTHIPESA
jgi:hypothetical protein